VVGPREYEPGGGFLDSGDSVQGDEDLDGGALVWDRTFNAIPLVSRLVRGHGVPKATRIVKDEDLDNLRSREDRLQGLLRSEWYLTTEELAARAEAFVRFLKLNRTPVLATGYPNTRFTTWPAPLCVNLYPVKVPRNLFDDSFSTAPGRPQLNQLITSRPPWLWCCLDAMPSNVVPLGNQDASGCPVGWISCGYEDAPLMKGLDAGHAQRLEAGRDTLLDLKIRVFDRLAQALQRGSASGLWADCLGMLTDKLLGSDADFYLKMDHQWGSDLQQAGELARSKLEESLPGGLTEILEIMGYCEKELTIRTMDRTKQTLEHLLDPANPDPYLSALGTARRAQIDAVLDELEALVTKEAAFWGKFKARVNAALQNEFFEEVSVPVRVKRPHAAQFEPHLKLLADFSRDHLARTGVLPTLELSVSPSSPANHFHREGQIWHLAFDGKEAHVKDSKGIRYISYLIHHPNQEIHILDLVLEIEGTAVPSENLGRQPKCTSLEEIGSSGEGFGDAGPVADQQTKQELWQRLQEIEQKIADKEEIGDSLRADALRACVERG
jgi:hypothetical protein